MTVVATFTGADGASLTLRGAADPATDRFALAFDYEAMLALVAATDPAVAADPLLADATAIFGGPWELRAASEAVFVRNEGLLALAGGEAGQWVRLPPELARSLVAEDGLRLLALPQSLAARLADDPALTRVSDDAEGVGGVRYTGTATVGGAPTEVSLWLEEGGAIVRADLRLADASTLVTRYAAAPAPRERDLAPPRPAAVIDLPAGLSSRVEDRPPPTEPLDPMIPLQVRATRVGLMSDRVSVSIEGGVADVRLDRADKMNALDVAMFDALVTTSEALAADSSVRCVVLSGEGRGFCAGLDFSGFEQMANRPAPGTSAPGTTEGVGRVGALAEGRITHHGQQAVYGWTELPVPVIAAVHGVALGGGIQLALGADIRIVAPDARLSVLEIRWGLVPDMTGTQRLVELVGLDVAKELTFTGRMVSGEEAVRLGLATRLADDPRAEALALAADIAAKSPHAVRGAKRLLNAARRVSEADGFAMERAEIGALIGSPNQVESVMAYFEKRAPTFADPD